MFGYLDYILQIWWVLSPSQLDSWFKIDLQWKKKDHLPWKIHPWSLQVHIFRTWKTRIFQKVFQVNTKKCLNKLYTMLHFICHNFVKHFDLLFLLWCLQNLIFAYHPNTVYNCFFHTASCGSVLNTFFVWVWTHHFWALQKAAEFHWWQHGNFGRLILPGVKLCLWQQKVTLPETNNQSIIHTP